MSSRTCSVSLAIAGLLAAARAATVPGGFGEQGEVELPDPSPQTQVQMAVLSGKIQKHMNQEVAELRAKDTQDPGKGYGQLAAELEDNAKWFAQASKERGSSWFPSANAYVYSFQPNTVYFGNQSFNTYAAQNWTDHSIAADEKSRGEKATLGMERRLAEEIRLGELVSTVIHERNHVAFQHFYTKKYIHNAPRWYATFMPWEAGDPQAYTIQYKWLRVLNDDPMRKWKDIKGQEFDASELTNVLDWLGEYGVIPNTPIKERLDAAKRALDGKLGVPPEPWHTPWPAPWQDLPKPPLPPGLDPNTIAVKLPPPPGLSGPFSDEYRRKQVTEWRDACLATLKEGMDKDPLREANKKEYLTLVGGPRAFTCKRCGYKGNHYWFGDRWSCPGCEQCVQPQDLKRADGLTYNEYAAKRKKLYEDKMAEIRKQADELLRKR